MKYYPIFVRAAGQKCLVVGGGPIAEQKVRSLVNAGAAVNVVSPELTEGLETMDRDGSITCTRRPYQSGDTSGCFLVFAATGRDAVDRQIANEAAERGGLVNAVDRPELCNFISPAVVARDDLTIAISTSGASPAMARHLRQRIETQIGPEYGLALQLLGRLRARLKGLELPTSERSRMLNQLVESPLLELLRDRRFGEVDTLLSEVTCQQVSLGNLEIDWIDIQ